MLCGNVGGDVKIKANLGCCVPMQVVMTRLKRILDVVWCVGGNDKIKANLGCCVPM